MYILGKRADLLDEADIRRLVENRVQESKSLDYKKELKIGQDKDKKEFLYDVSAMYNTEGGCLVFGIEESKDEKGYNTGTPAAICGINIDNSDKLTQQIEDIIKGNSEPRISNIILNIIEMEGIFILVIGIPKGLGFPSMITFNESNKFYKRRNSGKYAVDVYELNQMFMQNQILKEYAEKFRSERIEKVRNLKVFPMLDNTVSFFIQIIPFSFINERTLDFTQIENMNLTTTMKPMGASGWDKMFNLDGFATFSISHDRQKIISYDQIFRNGIYEVYTSSVFEQVKDDKGAEVNCIYGQYLISNTIEKIQNGLTVLQKFQIEPPFLICLSIHNIYNGTIKGDRWFGRRFMTNEIILPTTILPTYETNIYTELKSNFDILWQSIGCSSSPRE